ncbi:MAG: hypothetical protein P8K08_18910 [Fuerstiella sp.]|jgi:hypothetical protein|nr:hypothetical protein [Fuerstiella sp.]
MSEANAVSPLADRIEAIESEVREVQSAINASRKSRRIIMLFFLLFVLAIGLAFYQLVNRLQSESFQTDLATLAQTHLDEHTDIYTNEVQLLVDTTSPVLVEALRSRFEEDKPRYTSTLDEHRDILVENVRPKLEGLVQERYGEILVSFEGVIAEEFPDAADPAVQARIQDNLESGMSKLVQKYYVDSIQTRLEGIMATWDTFPPADPPGEGMESLSEQLIGALLEMLSQRIAEKEEFDPSLL